MPSSIEYPESPVVTASIREGDFVDAFGGRYVRIADCGQLPTFFMNVVSESDLWLFLASNGALSAGRGDADHALFPYQSVDRIYDSAGLVGPFTAMWIGAAGQPALWEPFAPHGIRLAAVRRNLFKSIEGDRVWFEEINEELGVAFRSGWATAAEYGLVRQCELHNLRDDEISVHLLDGLRNVLPAGIPRRLQDTSSCLADAYKTSELLPDTTLAVYALAAAIVDRAIPMEMLRASAVWSEGLPGAAILLSDGQINGFLRGDQPATETRRRGVRCSYLLSTALTLRPHAVQRWIMVADTGLSQGAIVARQNALRAGGLAPAVLRSQTGATRRLRALIGSADGFQTGGEESVTAHHCANVLFNLMRGGVFASGQHVQARDVVATVRERNRAVAARHRAFLDTLPPALAVRELYARVARSGDPALERLVLEFLPLTFGRRHGDPSRPWNRFTIRVRDEHGDQVLHYEGNWRDIFQNWEALCLSFPEFLEPIVAKFVNASTADGFNPYRINSSGIEWEVPDAEHPHATIGYWGDHQIVYLLKLLEWSDRFHPGKLESWLRRDLFSYADVPYRIASYDAMRRNPRSTIEFDLGRHRRIEARVAGVGTDARLLGGDDGSVVQVNLTEKLLLTMLVRLTNFVPGAGIWMNTQRPEWNDANNALVGNGASMVTLCHLRRMLAHWREVLQPALGTEPVEVSSALAGLASRLLEALEVYRSQVSESVHHQAGRRMLFDAMAECGSVFRESIYREGLGERALVNPLDIARLVEAALVLADETIRANRRPDGLYHAYNLIEFVEEPAGLRIEHLGPMLEGQVAVLSAGLLSPAGVVALLEALQTSALYRADQHSYLLYPDRQLPDFLERNVIPDDALDGCALIEETLAAGDARLVLRDVSGRLRFHPDLVDAAALEERLHVLGRESRWCTSVARDRERVLNAYEQVFHHRAFTGRSGTMFGYEGLGCIYWHMVAKLLVAVQENVIRARNAADPHLPRLVEQYFDIRAGLGFNKTPKEFGAFPTDPYSHSPGHSGAQQPGMTGQVKEEILTRLGELGVEIAGGTIAFRPFLLRETEFTANNALQPTFDARGVESSIAVPAGALSFSVCGVPVVYRRTDGEARVIVHWRDESVQEVAGQQLDEATSTAVFDRSGRIGRIEVELGFRFQPCHVA